jgi:hypothetical protein
MTQLKTEPCTDDACWSFTAGHRMHHIQARLTGESPWGWRDGTVVAADGHWLHIAYTLEQACPKVWHHEPLEPAFPVGTPIRLHERFHVLGSPGGWLNVIVQEGLGSIPEPAEPAAWTAEITHGAVDMGTGVGLPLDHVGH